MRNILSLITEDILAEGVVSEKELFDAIDNHRNVLINYHTKGEDKNTGARVIQVYSYFINKSGNKVIRAFQPYGDTTSRNPDWKTFRVDRITYWEPKGTYKEPPTGYMKQDGGSVASFRKDGDSMASVMIRMAEFGKEKKKYKYITYYDKEGKKHRKRSYLYKSDADIRKNDELLGKLDNSVSIADIKDKDGNFRQQEKELRSQGYDDERKKAEIDKAWAEWEKNANGGKESEEYGEPDGRNTADYGYDGEEEGEVEKTNPRHDIDDIWSSWEKNAGVDRLGDEYFDDKEAEEKRNAKHTDRIMQRRDDRWQKRSDRSKMWRKDANAF